MRSTNVPEPFDTHTHLAYLNVNWDINFATLSSSTSWSKHEVIAPFDLGTALNQCCDPTNPNGFSLFNAYAGTSKYAEELRLTSRGEQRLTWLLGGYVTREDSHYNYSWDSYTPEKTLSPPPGYFLLVEQPVLYREWAFFGDATFRITDRWEITGGARYASNWESTCRVTSDGIFGPGPAPCSDRPYQGKTTWLGTLGFHLTPDTMLYGRVATGY